VLATKKKGFIKLSPVGRVDKANPVAEELGAEAEHQPENQERYDA
jgi:hypothetical protein